MLGQTDEAGEWLAAERRRSWPAGSPPAPAGVALGCGGEASPFEVAARRPRAGAALGPVLRLADKCRPAGIQCARIAVAWSHYRRAARGLLEVQSPSGR